MTAETWYVMADGTYCDPREVACGADGLLRHKDGRAVAYAPHGPRSRSVDPDRERAKRALVADESDKMASDDREMKPAGGKAYRTRGGKAD